MTFIPPLLSPPLPHLSPAQRLLEQRAPVSLPALLPRAPLVALQLIIVYEVVQRAVAVDGEPAQAQDASRVYVDRMYSQNVIVTV